MKKIAILTVLCLLLCTACGSEENQKDHTVEENRSTTIIEQEPVVNQPTAERETTIVVNNDAPTTTTTETHVHSFSEATCIEAGKCECGDTKGTALGHNWEEATCNAPKTCKICGATDGTALGHNYSAANCYLPQVCSRCNTTQGSALGHDYRNNLCVRCGEVDPNSLPVALNALVVVDANPASGYSYDSGVIKDSYGNTYAGYYEYEADMFDPVTVNYNLERKYKTFSFDLIAPDYTESKAVLDVLIYVDDKLVYYATDYTKLVGAKHIVIDVTGGQRLTVKVSKTNDEGIANMYNKESVAFVNAVLEK